MFEGLLHRAQRTLDSALSKFLGRAAVAVPLLVALGFGTAALTVKLTELYGQVASYVAMAVVFALIGGLVAAVVSATTEVDAPEPAPQEDAASSVTGAVAPLLDKDMLLALLTTAGPIAVPRLIAMAARNLPLLVMAGLLAIFFFSRSAVAETQGAQSGSSASEPEAPPVA